MGTKQWGAVVGRYRVRQQETGVWHVVDVALVDVPNVRRVGVAARVLCGRRVRPWVYQQFSPTLTRYALGHLCMDCRARLSTLGALPFDQHDGVEVLG